MSIKTLISPSFALGDYLGRAYRAMPPVMQDMLQPARRWALEHHNTLRMKREVDAAAEDVRFASRYHRGPKIFIDCGFNEGRVMERFLHDLPGFEFHGFEVNPQFREAAERLRREHPNIMSMNFAAVSDRDGETTFWLGGSPDGYNKYDGTTIVPVKVSGAPQYDRPLTTPTVDLSRWIRNYIETHRAANDNIARPFIAVKMDIEGAEFDVLEHMLQPTRNPGGRLQQPAAVDLDVLIVEFHAAQMQPELQDEFRERQRNIVSGLRDAGVLIHEWY